MRYHLNASRMWGCVVLALAFPATADPAVAEEAGQWFGRAVLVTLSSKSVKLEDRADHTLSVTEYDGAVFNADGKPFLDKARYQVVDQTDAGTSSGGYKTFTEADGSKVFAKYVLTRNCRSSAAPSSSLAARENMRGSRAAATTMSC